jgi:catechol 2,3-dioxygenase-like lactoylglutathione lyase family enzyme
VESGTSSAAPAIEVRRVDFAYVPTREFARAEEFYGGVLGLEISKRYGQMPGAEFETGNLTLAVIQPDAFGQEFHANRNGIALRVDDVGAARAELESRGVSFLGDTIDSGVCHMAFFEDPDGNVLLLHNRYAPPDARPPGM